MIKLIAGAVFKVISKIGLAAITERFLAKIAFDVLHWIASLTTNKVDDQRVKDLEDIYYGKGDTHAMDTTKHDNR